MAVKKETSRSGAREIFGLILLGLCVLGACSLWSYDWRDISQLQFPPNRPPANFIGPVGAWGAYIAMMGFGICAYAVPVALAYFGFACLFKREGVVWPKAVWLVFIVASLCSIVEIHPSLWTPACERLNLLDFPGGVIGDLFAARALVSWFGSLGATIASLTILATGIFLLIDVHPVSAGRTLGEWIGAAWTRHSEWRRTRMDRVQQLEEEEREVAKQRRKLEEVIKQPDNVPPKVSVRPKRTELPDAPPPRPPPTVISADEHEVPEPPAKPSPAAKPAKQKVETPKEPVREIVKAPAPVAAPAVAMSGGISAMYQKLRREKPEEAKPVEKPKVFTTGAPATAPSSVPQPKPEYKVPGLDLLDPLPPESSRDLGGDLNIGSQILKETLAEFGIEVEMTHVERGPVVTRYQLLPAPGVRVEKITSLSNNIALAMKAETIRVQAPIPGKGVVGIEVPNLKSTAVYLREILESPEWQSGKASLPLALGKDVGGRVLVADLAEMPHLLIAGATGSGKTVCMNSILTGLLAARTPEQLRLMLVDPKIVEFASYNNLPHLVVPVVTDAKKVALGLRWAINEMEKRYKMFAKVGVRNIKGFNSRPIAKQTELFSGTEVAAPAAGAAVPPPPPPQPQLDGGEKIPDRIPYIVIVVDELADLMLVAQAEIENSIARLAQLSRAVGIHLIIATQRPSVNVITGTIKANFPARIAFQVASKVDSRTILDTIGADKLLGKGDMLFLPPGSGKLIRAQGTFTSDNENRRIIEFIKQQGAPEFEASIKDKIEGKQVDLPDMEEDDGLIEQSMQVIRETRRASTSSLQRRLRIGYTRAARIMDLLEERGIVGPAQGSDPREILIDLDGEVPQNSNELDGGGENAE